jgi:hypothetical protein
LGDDAEENLITLCAACHAARHAAVQTAEKRGSLEQALTEIK